MHMSVYCFIPFLLTHTSVAGRAGTKYQVVKAFSLSKYPGTNLNDGRSCADVAGFLVSLVGVLCECCSITQKVHRVLQKAFFHNFVVSQRPFTTSPARMIF